MAGPPVNLISHLHRCRREKSIRCARCVYSYMCEHRLENDHACGNFLIVALVDCGSLADAQRAFDMLPHRNEYSWSSLISGYIECSEFHHAFHLYDKMQEDNVQPNTYTFVALLKACTQLKDAARGQEFRAEICRRGLHTDPFVGSSLVDMFAKCGWLEEAQKVFNELPTRNVVTWTALLQGYTEHGHGRDALKCLEQMQLQGLPPDVGTFICGLKTCGSMGYLREGQDLHSEILTKGLERELYMGNTLVDMYAKCGSLTEAQHIFYQLQVRNIVSWTTLVAGYAENGLGDEALNCFEQMKLDGIFPNSHTYVSALKACGSKQAKERVQQLHSEIVWKGFGKDVFVGSMLVDAYSNCGLLAQAQELFDQLPVKNAVLWTALTAGYVEHGFGEEGLNLYKRMQADGVYSDSTTFACSLKACGLGGDLTNGQEIHHEIIKRGFERELYVASTLVDMYAKSSSLADAQSVFERIRVRDAVLWAALISGYAEHGCNEEVLSLFKQMQLEGRTANNVTFVHCLKACGLMAALETGRELHFQIRKLGLEKNLYIANTLIDMYGKCGSLVEGQEVFDNLSTRDVVSWNAMIKGYGDNFGGRMAINCFRAMQEQGVKPNATTFTCLLAACSQAHLVFEGHEYFELMREHYKVEPTFEHHTCMVDLLARSGDLYEAERFAEGVKSVPSLKALLTACKTYGEVEVGLRCFQQLIQLNPEDASAYLLMADIYESTGRFGDAHTLDKLRESAHAEKKSASALIEVDKNLYKFHLGEKHITNTSALKFLNSNMKEEGYVPNLHSLL